MAEEQLDDINRRLGGIEDHMSWIAKGVVAIAVFNLGSCLSQLDISDSLRAVSTQYNQPEIHTENVIGDRSLEKFYEIDNQRVYLEVDGKPVESYFNQR